MAEYKRRIENLDLHAARPCGYALRGTRDSIALDSPLEWQGDHDVRVTQGPVVSIP